MKAVLVNVVDECAGDPPSWGGQRLHTVYVTLEFDGEARPRTAERLVAGALRRAGMRKRRQRRAKKEAGS